MNTRRIRQVALILILLVLPALFLRANAKNAQDLNFLDRLILRATAPIQTGLSKVAWAIHDFGSNYFALVGVKKENQQLLKENQELKAQIQTLSLEKEHVERLEQLLRFKNELKYGTVAAQIVARDSFPLLGRTVQIRFDKENQEVKPGMPVITTGGVVGKVLHTYADTYATVQLIVDANFSVPVYLPKTRSMGILRGTGQDNKLQIEFVNFRDEIQMDDPIMTTGIGARGTGNEMIGSGFPSQLYVGQVSGITKSPSGLDQKLQITPAVNLKEVREVLIVLSPLPPKDPQSTRSGPRASSTTRTRSDR